MAAKANAEDIEQYTAQGWWSRNATVSSFVRENALRDPDGIAYQSDGNVLTWSDYDNFADQICSSLIQYIHPGDRVLVWMPDGGMVHASYLGCERAGAIAVGVGWRSGYKELEHLTHRTGSIFLICPAMSHLGDCIEVAQKLELPFLMLGENMDSRIHSHISETRIGPSDLWFLNSTSGTTGVPKCVMQTQNRWFYFHKKAVEFGNLNSNEVWMSVVPAPFGFGLWTAHITPTILGAPCHVQKKFDAEAAVQVITQNRVSVLCAVSSQFVMILDAADNHDLSSLNVVFTGGEAISANRAAELEEKAGCRVLNFYGSNETGTLSGTTVNDPPDKRYTTGGRTIPEMQVRLYDHKTGHRVSDSGVGQPACKGPALSLGYWEDSQANKELRTEDGWFLMGDLVEIDSQGWLRVVGRTSDFIIRGGKNISAVAVEDEIESHPAVALVAVVAKPDEKLGETAAAFVQLHPGMSLTHDELKNYLSHNGVTIDWWPETFKILNELPMSSGGKVAKGELRRIARNMERHDR